MSLVPIFYLWLLIVDVHLIAADHILAAQGCFPPIVGWHVVTIPRHEVAPFGSCVPGIVDAGSCFFRINVGSAFCQGYELVWVASLNLLEFLCLLGGIESIEVSADDVYVLVARIPVGIVVVGVGIFGLFIDGVVIGVLVPPAVLNNTK